MGILDRFLGWFFFFFYYSTWRQKGGKKASTLLSTMQNTRCLKSNSCIPCPLGPGPNNSWGERWMERGREGRWRLNGTHAGELKRKEKARPKKSHLEGSNIPILSYHYFQCTTTPNCPSDASFLGKIWAHPLCMTHKIIQQWLWGITRS